MESHHVPTQSLEHLLCSVIPGPTRDCSRCSFGRQCPHLISVALLARIVCHTQNVHTRLCLCECRWGPDFFFFFFFSSSVALHARIVCHTQNVHTRLCLCECRWGPDVFFFFFFFFSSSVALLASDVEETSLSCECRWGPDAEPRFRVSVYTRNAALPRAACSRSQANWASSVFQAS